MYGSRRGFSYARPHEAAITEHARSNARMWAKAAGEGARATRLETRRIISHMLFWRTLSSFYFRGGIDDRFAARLSYHGCCGFSIGRAWRILRVSAQDSANPKPNSASGKRPIIVCANNGFNYLDAAYAFLAGGGDTLDAALRVVKGPEDDPNDTSVGLGGMPNEEGVVELDACCMHGPTRRAGSVGGVRNIKNVSLVSKAVMDHTGHVMLVGEGAERFAVADGISSRESADRSLAKDLAAVEGVSLERRLVGTGVGRSALAASGRQWGHQAAS